MLTLFADNKEINLNRVKFSDGAVSFNLVDFPENTNSVVISASSDYKVSGLIDELSQLADALWEAGYYKGFKLYTPYLPYARADRKFSKNGNKGLSTFLSNLSNLGVDNITTVDPHNELALKDACYNVDIEVEFTSQLEAFKYTMSRSHVIPSAKWDCIVAPDKGAKIKAKSIADYFNINLVECSKDRDVATGKLSNPVVPERLDGKSVVIVDDLFDGGYTYIQLADELKRMGATSVDLYVTHLIASKGLDVLTDKVNNLYTYHTCCGYVTMQDVINFNKGEICA